MHGQSDHVDNGDPIDVLTDDNETVCIRFHGTDCPERGQPGRSLCVYSAVARDSPVTPRRSRWASVQSGRLVEGDEKTLAGKLEHS